jgi:hypothetical protein
MKVRSDHKDNPQPPYPVSTSQTQMTLSHPPLTTYEVACPHPADPKLVFFFLSEGDNVEPEVGIGELSIKYQACLCSHNHPPYKKHK